MAVPAHCPSRVTGMTLRPELSEHAGRQIGIFGQMYPANQQIEHANPRVWVTDMLRISRLTGLRLGCNDEKMLRASWRVELSCWGPKSDFERRIKGSKD